MLSETAPVELEISTSKAEQALQSVSSGAQKFREALDRVGENKSFDQVASRIENMKGVPSNVSTGLRTLQQNTQALGDQASKVAALSNEFQKLGQGGGLSQAATNIAATSNAAQRLAAVTGLDRPVTNVRLLGVASMATYQNIDRLNNALTRLGGASSNVTQLTSSFTAFGNAVQQGGTRLAFLAAGFSVLRAGLGLDPYTLAMNAINGITSAYTNTITAARDFNAVVSEFRTPEEMKTALDVIGQLAAKAGLAAPDVKNLYTSFAQAANAAGLSAEETNQTFTESVTGFRAMGADAQGLSVIMGELGKVMQQQPASMDAVEQALKTRGPQALKTMAEALDMTTEAFKKAATDGTISASEIAKAVAAVSKAYGKDLSSSVSTLDKIWGVLTASVGKFNEAMTTTATKTEEKTTSLSDKWNTLIQDVLRYIGLVGSAPAAPASEAATTTTASAQPAAAPAPVQASGDDVLAGGTAQAGGGFDDLSDKAQTATTALTVLATVAGAVGGVLASTGGGATSAGDAVATAGQKANGAQAGLEGVATAAGNASSGLYDASSAAVMFSGLQFSSMDGLSEEFLEIGGSAESMGEDFDDVMNTMNELNEVFGEPFGEKAQFNQVSEEVRTLGETFEQLVPNVEEANSTVGMLAEVQDELRNAFDQTSEAATTNAAASVEAATATTTLSTAATTAATSEDTLNTAIQTGIGAAQGLSQAADQAAGSLSSEASAAANAASATDQYAQAQWNANAAAAAYTPPATASPSGGGGGSGGSSSESSVDSMFSDFDSFSGGGISHKGSGRTVRAPISAFINAPHFADGGISDGGIPAILHENEAVVPLTGGGAIPIQNVGSTAQSVGGSGPLAVIGMDELNIVMKTVVDKLDEDIASVRAFSEVYEEQNRILINEVIAVGNQVVDAANAIVQATTDAIRASSSGGSSVGSGSSSSGSSGGGSSGSSGNNSGIFVGSAGRGVGTAFSSGGGGSGGSGFNYPDNWILPMWKGRGIGTAMGGGSSGGGGGSANSGANDSSILKQFTSRGMFEDGSPNAFQDLRGGFTATLHPDEAVIPLPDGRAVPVDISGWQNARQNVSFEPPTRRQNVTPDADGGRDPRRGGPSQSPGGRAPVVNMTINTPDANSFRKSRDQILTELRSRLNHASDTVGSTPVVDDPTVRPSQRKGRG